MSNRFRPSVVESLTGHYRYLPLCHRPIAPVSNCCLDPKMRGNSEAPIPHGTIAFQETRCRCPHPHPSNDRETVLIATPSFPPRSLFPDTTQRQAIREAPWRRAPVGVPGGQGALRRSECVERPRPVRMSVPSAVLLTLARFGDACSAHFFRINEPGRGRRRVRRTLCGELESWGSSFIVRVWSVWLHTRPSRRVDISLALNVSERVR